MIYPKVDAMKHAVETTEGATPTALRQDVINFAKDPDHYPIDSIPEILRTYINKVVHYAYRVTDKDIQALSDGGYTDEEIFELTVSAALGASLRRFQKAIGVLER